MKNIFVLLVALVLVNVSFAQPIASFPSMEVYQLDQQKIQLPLVDNHKKSMVLVLGSKKAEKDLSTWAQDVYNNFIVKDQTGLAAGDELDIEVFLLVMLPNLSKSANESITQEVQKAFDKSLWKHVLLHKGESEQHLKAMGIKNAEIPYIFILDKNGKILHKTSGTYTEEKFSELEKWAE